MPWYSPGCAKFVVLSSVQRPDRPRIRVFVGFRITATDEMLDVVSENMLRLMGMERRGIRREERIY
eukprot:2930-Eustigmatos_ZCMA.PRE.1